MMATLPSIQVKSGRFDVIASGTIVGLPEDGLSFTIGEEASGSLLVEFRFSHEADSEKKVSAAIPTRDHLVITLTNWNNVLGTSLVNQKIGELYNRALYVSFANYALGDNPINVFHYMFCLGEKSGET